MIHREYKEPSANRSLACSLAKHWTDEPIEFVRNFANIVYRVRRHPRPWYLRITSSQRRSIEQLKSELEVVRHLGANGLPVSEAVPARDGHLLHVSEVDDQIYFGCMFEEAPGVYFNSESVTLEQFFRSVGRTMGLLHRTLEKFERPKNFVRFHWKEDRWQDFEKNVPKRETEAWELFEYLGSWLSEQPTDSSLFGLIHGDFTLNNLRIHQDSITLFDFDSCCEHWHAYEIAAFLHYFGGQDPKTRELAYASVLDGYAATRSPTPKLINQIPLFGKMRLLFSFLVFAGEWGFEGLSPEQEAYFELRRRLFRSPPTWPYRTSEL